jgi:CPA2 family monovalent cation:H+ antiporter-2
MPSIRLAPAAGPASNPSVNFDAPYTKELLLFLATAGLVVPLFRRLKLSPVLGFLTAGVALGPYGFGALARRFGPLSAFALDDVASIAPVAEFGVVFLLFMIGLELSWDRLARMRRLVFGLGALQVFGSAAVLGAVALALHAGPAAALVLGFALALSSTAVVIQVLAESRRLGTAAGRTIFSVLLFQDLMVAPLLVMVTIFGMRGGDIGWVAVTTLVPALAGLSLLVVGGRLVVRPLFHHVAAAGSTEFFMAASLFVVIGTGLLAALSGLSMGLGAFTAGLLLAETEYRREIELTIDPFKGLLLGLFFMSVGAELDLAQIAAHPLTILGLAGGLVVAKVAVAWIAARVLGLSNRVANETALMLGSGGEFAFVLIGAAAATQLVPQPLAAHAEIAVTLTMFAVPALAWVARGLRRRPLAADAALGVIPEPAEDVAGRAIIVGYGRVGQLVGEMMTAHDIAYVAVDQSVATVRTFRSGGIDIYWGDAARPDFLARCGLAKATALVITLDRAAAAEEIVTTARAMRPDLIIVARARDAPHATRLYALGATDAVPETIEASLQLSEAVLVDMGVAMGTVIAAVHEKRDAYRRLLQPVDGQAKARRAVKMSSRKKEMQRLPAAKDDPRQLPR